VDYAGFNYRLKPDSPASMPAEQGWMYSAEDLGWPPRINQYYGNIVDIGAYEYVPLLTMFEIAEAAPIGEGAATSPAPKCGWKQVVSAWKFAPALWAG